MNGPVLLLGIASEPPVRAVAEALARRATPHVVVDQRDLLAGDCHTWLTRSGVGGVLEVDGEQVRLEGVPGVYTRLTSWGELPALSADPGLLHRARQLHLALEAWLESTPATVVNRTSVNDTNNSKPYQTLLIREHFDVPATLVTNDAGELARFREEFGEVVYKSVSGERSIVTRLTDEDLARADALAHCPVQFQEYVPGVDVRVHVVGAEVFANRVDSQAVDYRYDATGSTRIRPVDLGAAVARECRHLAARLGLHLAGIDLRLAADGRTVCFEVNPSPAFTVYEDSPAGPVADALARHLAGAGGG